MAEEYAYLQTNVPDNEASAKILRLDWSGLNMRQKLNTGELSDCNNISTDESPYLSPSGVIHNTQTTVENPLALTATDDGVFTVGLSADIDFDDIDSSSYGTITLKYYAKSNDFKNPAKTGESSNTKIKVSTNYLDSFVKTLYDKLADKKMSATTFMLYKDNKITNDPTVNFVLSPIYSFEHTGSNQSEPGQLPKISNPRINSCTYSTSAETYRFSTIESDSTVLPYLPYLTVHLSRLFAGGKSVVGASAYGNYGDWETDLAYIRNDNPDGYGANHAWVSTVQSDEHGFTGDITGITTFNDRVIVFKKDTMFEVYNNKNPFRISRISGIGTIDNRSIQNVSGILVFASEKDVFAYTGSGITSIGNVLNIDTLSYAVAGSDGRKYYLYAEGLYRDGKEFRNIFVYDYSAGVWTKQDAPEGKALSMVYKDDKLYSVFITEQSKDTKPYMGTFYILNTKDYTGQKWFAETDIICSNTSGGFTISPKRIKNIKTLAEIGAGSSLSIYLLKADEEYVEGITQPLKTYTNTTEESMRIPIRLNVRMKADYGARLRIEGTGYSKVYSTEITYTDGGEMSNVDREGISKS